MRSTLIFKVDNIFVHGFYLSIWVIPWVIDLEMQAPDLNSIYSKYSNEIEMKKKKKNQRSHK